MINQNHISTRLTKVKKSDTTTVKNGSKVMNDLSVRLGRWLSG